MTAIDELKFNIREDIMPYFTDEQLEFILGKNKNNVKKASYECLILKAENTQLSGGSLSLQDTSSYFKMLASKYKPINSRLL